MAGTLVSDLIVRFQLERYSDCPADVALSYVNAFHRRLGKLTGIRTGSTDISLTSGIREYARADTLLKIHEAYYVTSSSSWTKLEPITTNDLDDENLSWRITTDTGSPTRYYTTAQAASDESSGGYIGFDAIPDTTTTLGYPKVVLYTTDIAALDTDSRLPDQLLDDEVYLDGMAALWAKRKDEDKYAYWETLAANGLNRLQSYLQNLTPRSPRFAPSYIRHITTI